MQDALRQLDEFGFLLLPAVLPTTELDELRSSVEELFDEEGEAAGREFKQEPGARRLANLVNKGPLFQSLVAHPAVLPLVGHVLSGRVKLSSMNARVAAPGGQRQPLHCDMGALPDEHGAWVCNVVWMLDDFTTENGALRVVPTSHRWHRLPQDALPDPTADYADQRLVTGQAGSVILINAHLWHGGMANGTERPRTAVHAFYCRRDKPQQQYQKALLDSSLQAAMSPELRYLLALDDPLNDQLAKQDIARSGFLR